MAFTTLKELEGRPDMEWLIDGILPKGKVCAVWGDTEAGKSFLMVDWAGCVASGIPWQGRAVSGPGAVAYIPTEDGADEYRRRFAGWQQAYGPLSDIVIEEDGGVQLLDEASVQRCIDDIRALQRPPALIILDTYGKSIVDAMRSDRGDGDRNETNRALRNADRIRQAAGRHATIVLVTHSTKDGRTQAHSAAFKQGLYMVARLIGTATDGSTGTFRCEKLKTKHFADTSCCSSERSRRRLVVPPW